MEIIEKRNWIESIEQAKTLRKPGARILRLLDLRMDILDSNRSLRVKRNKVSLPFSREIMEGNSAIKEIDVLLKDAQRDIVKELNVRGKAIITLDDY